MLCVLMRCVFSGRWIGGIWGMLSDHGAMTTLELQMDIVRPTGGLLSLGLCSPNIYKTECYSPFQPVAMDTALHRLIDEPRNSFYSHGFVESNV